MPFSELRELRQGPKSLPRHASDRASSHPAPHPEVPASAGLEGGLQGSRGWLEASFEARLRLAPQDEGEGWNDGKGRRSRTVGRFVFALCLLTISLGPASAIVGGREAPDAPEAASSVMVLTSNGGVCTGVVVARDAVLTAGHCVSGAGENRIHFRDAAGQPVLIETRERVVHPGYAADAIRARTRSIDLALLRAREPLPARFATAGLSTEMPEAGALLSLGGYGATRQKDPRSLGRFRTVDLTVVEPHGPSRILVWLQAGRAGGCNGDSGGPIGQGGRVLALAAWVKDGCGGLTQGILLGPQRDWIDRTLAGWGLAARWAP